MSSGTWKNHIEFAHKGGSQLPFGLQDANKNPRLYLLAQISKIHERRRFAANPTANYIIFAATQTRTHSRIGRLCGSVP